MFELKKIDYADCFQGLIQYIIENNNMSPNLMYIKSWGFECKDSDEECFDIRNNDFFDVLRTYYGIEVEELRTNTIQQNIGIIIERLRYNKVCLLHVDAYSCSWNVIFQRKHIFHYLLVTEITEGIAKCIDIFYPDEYHYYDLYRNQEYVRKLENIDLSPISYETIDVIRDLKNTLIDGIKEHSVSKELVNLANSSNLKEMVLKAQPIETNQNIYNCKKVKLSRKGILALVEEYLEPEEELKAMWEDVIVDWQKVYNFLLKSSISETIAQSMYEKIKKTLIGLATKEEACAKKTLERLHLIWGE